MKLNERIKELRKALGLTQQEFSDKIGVKRNTIAQYESGRNAPIDAVISLICREFNVSEEWLRNGTGDMWVKVDEDQELQDILAQITLSGDELITRIIKAYWKLPEKEKDMIRKLVDRMIEKNTPEK